MSLIHDIQAGAIEKNADLPSLLRQCKLLAARIAHENFAGWVDRELSGYSTIDSLPDYRIVAVDSFGDFVGPYGSGASNMQIPVSILPNELQQAFRNAYLMPGVSSYLSLLDGDGAGYVKEQWPLGLAVHHASGLLRGMQCIAAWKVIPIGAVHRLLDSVKTRILGFAIDLEKAAPNAGDAPIGSKPPLSPETMTHIFNMNIGQVGNLSNAGTNFSQSAIVEVARNDWKSLEDRLTQLGVDSTDLVDMRRELDQASSDAERETTGKSWIGRLVSKAVSGTSGVAVEVASTGIAKAICAFLGLPVA